MLLCVYIQCPHAIEWRSWGVFFSIQYIIIVVFIPSVPPRVYDQTNFIFFLSLSLFLSVCLKQTTIVPQLVDLGNFVLFVDLWDSCKINANFERSFSVYEKHVFRDFIGNLLNLQTVLHDITVFKILRHGMGCLFICLHLQFI